MCGTTSMRGPSYIQGRPPDSGLTCSRARLPGGRGGPNHFLRTRVSPGGSTTLAAVLLNQKGGTMAFCDVCGSPVPASGQCPKGPHESATVDRNPHLDLTDTPPQELIPAAPHQALSPYGGVG